jgi:hypothetical protein
MSHTVDILIVVDALAAVANPSNNIGNNVYLVDTNKHIGSGCEGSNELHTACKDGEVLSWRVVAIDPGSDVSIKSFTGDIKNDRVCLPTKQGLASDVHWDGLVQAQGHKRSYQYSVLLTIDGTDKTFDPFLWTNGFSNQS